MALDAKHRIWATIERVYQPKAEAAAKRWTADITEHIERVSATERYEDVEGLDLEEWENMDRHALMWCFFFALGQEFSGLAEGHFHVLMNSLNEQEGGGDGDRG